MFYSSKCHFLLIAVAIMGSTIISQAGVAAELFMSPNFRDDISEINIVGEIEAGDVNHLQSLLQTAEPIINIKIWSPGGDLVEAMRLGRLVRERFLLVHAPDITMCVERPDPQLGGASSLASLAGDLWWGPDQPASTACVCYGACFVIWASGVIRDGGKNTYSYFADSPHVAPALTGNETFIGIHRPSFDRVYFASLSAKEAEEKYDQMIAELTRYFAEMDVPPSMVEKMLAVPSNDIRLLTRAELNSLSGPIPAVDEWIRSKCDALSIQETVDFSSLQVKKIAAIDGEGQSLSSAENFYFAALSKKLNDHYDCTNSAIAAEQESRR